MQNQITKKYSRIVLTAFFSAAAILIYEILISFTGIFLLATGALECQRQDFGGCALQNLFVGLLGFFVAVIFGLIIPVFLILANVIISVVGLKRRDGGKNLLLASLGFDGLALVLMGLGAAFALFFG